MNISIKAAGIGGQGIQFFGKLLSQAGFHQGLNVSVGTVYEPATTGGLTVSDIIIAHDGEEILYPFIEKPEICIFLAQRAWDEYKDIIQEYTILIVDKDQVKGIEGTEEYERAILTFNLPLFEKARELGSENVGNVVALGFVAEMLDFADNYVPSLLVHKKPEEAEEHELLEVDPKYFEESLVKSSPKKFTENNIQAFKIGYQMSAAIDYPREIVSKQMNQKRI